MLGSKHTQNGLFKNKTNLKKLKYSFFIHLILKFHWSLQKHFYGFIEMNAFWKLLSH